MNDIDENIIKEKLTNPPDFEYTDKPWIIAKSRLDFNRKLRRYGIYTLAFLFLLTASLVAIGRYWYISKLDKINEERLKLTNKILPNGSNIKDTVYQEKIVYVHDTIFKKVYINTGNKKKSLNRNLPGFFPVSIYNKNLVGLFYKPDSRLARLNYLNAGSIRIFSGLTAIKKSESIGNLYTKNNTESSENKQKWNPVIKLSTKRLFVKNNPKIINSDDYLYKQWLINLSKKIAKKKNSPSYKLEKMLNGFNVFGYDLGIEGGGLLSLSGVPSTGYVMGISGNLLFENGFKFTTGVKFIINNGEYRTQNISSQDFPPAPDTKDIFDGIYFNSSFWVIPVGFEYHFVKVGKIYPYMGMGWAMKSGTLNTVEYELHDINTFEEYKISNSFNGPVDLNNYWIKTGLNMNFSNRIGSSLEASYLFGTKKYEYNYLKLRSLIFSANVYYRFY